MKAGLYARVSTTDKDQDPEVQLRVLREYALNHKWEVYKEYVDHASGADCNRPSFQELISDAKRRRIDIVIVTRLSRFSRSTINTLTTIQDIKHHGVEFLCTEQNIDTSSAVGKVLLTVMAAFAEWERDNMRESVMEGLAKARAEGRRGGRKRVEIPEGVLDDAINYHHTQRTANPRWYKPPRVHRLLVEWGYNISLSTVRRLLKERASRERAKNPPSTEE